MKEVEISKIANVTILEEKTCLVYCLLRQRSWKRHKGLRKYHLTLPERKTVAYQATDVIAEILPPEEADLAYCT